MVSVTGLAVYACGYCGRYYEIGTGEGGRDHFSFQDRDEQNAYGDWVFTPTVTCSEYCATALRLSAVGVTL